MYLNHTDVTRQDALVEFPPSIYSTKRRLQKRLQVRPSLSESPYNLERSFSKNGKSAQPSRLGCLETDGETFYSRFRKVLAETEVNQEKQISL